MDKVIDARFERVEKALASLIESVSKYHPNAKQALDLHEADNDLARGLDEGTVFSNEAIHNSLLTLKISASSPKQPPAAAAASCDNFVP